MASSSKESSSTDATASGSTVRVAAVQMRSTLGDVVGNIARADALIRQAAGKDAKFVVLPETALHGYLSQNLQQTWHIPGRPLSNKIHGGNELMEPFGNLWQAAETVPGPITDHYMALSKELGTYIVVPFIEKEVCIGDSDGNNNHDNYRFYNTCVLTTPDGSIGLHYRKNHLWPLIDNAWACAGNFKSIMDTPYGRVGLAICFDVHVMFDRHRQCSPAKGEEKLWTLLYPIAWVDDLASDWFNSELPKRVQKAGFHVVGANWSVDQEQPWNGYGFSRVIRNDGVVLAKAETNTGDEILFADLEYTISTKELTH